jgi:uncharacterized protein
METGNHYTAFVGERLIVSGKLDEVLPKLKTIFDRKRSTMFLIFHDETGKQIDFDLRGSADEVLARVSPAPSRTGPGRPNLGVVSREVTLLPRQWDWLEMQPNGASATIRRLIDEARKRDPAKDRAQQAMHASARFLSAMAGNYPGYEEATRALYRRDKKLFEHIISDWPTDVRKYALHLSKGAF